MSNEDILAKGLMKAIDNITTPRITINPELNALTLCINRKLIRSLKLSPTNKRILYELLDNMNAQNIVVRKTILNIACRQTLSKALSKLETVGAIFSKPDKTIFISPKIACLSRMRSKYRILQDMWTGRKETNE